MKKVLYLIIAAFLTLSVSSCGAYQNMSSEDAYYIGYGAGTLLRNMIN